MGVIGYFWAPLSKVLTYKHLEPGLLTGAQLVCGALLPCGCGGELGFADGLAVAVPVNDFLFPALPCIGSAVEELHRRKKSAIMF